MRVTAIKDDSKINVDGQPLIVSRFPHTINNLHALQWEDGSGRIERKNTPNEKISDFDIVKPFVDEWKAEKERRETMPLEPARIRPNLSDSDTIYRRDIDKQVLLGQIKNKSTAIEQALNDGSLTVSIQEPTKSRAAAIIFEITAMEMSLESMVRFLDELVTQMGFRTDKVMVDLGNKRIEVPIEMYEQSAFVNQVSYQVGNLPS